MGTNLNLYSNIFGAGHQLRDTYALQPDTHGSFRFSGGISYALRPHSGSADNAHNPEQLERCNINRVLIQVFRYYAR